MIYLMHFYYNKYNNFVLEINNETFGLLLCNIAFFIIN